ncbi:lysosome-associated membrane glycoprotein 5-like [Anneissia japonica]|uniref:lysosome-associated membrane glycoprotein 5-like n=1 Tax=Anneissia japonica TaxID=1529436 RepID=UPI0014255941|nr:lysosome-associated membrane glycoprotein 5-like [Anneissia japonica]
MTTAEITDSLSTLEPLISTEQVQTSPEDITETEEPQVSSKPLGPYEFQVLNDDTGEVCIKAHLEAEVIVHYISSKKTSLQQATIPVDPKANVDGSCSSQQAVLTLKWSKFTLKTTFNMINDSLKCSNSKNERCWMLTSIQFTYDSNSKYFNHAKDARVKMVQSSVNKEFFRTPDTMSQSCDKDVLLKLPSTKDKNKDEVDIKFIKLQIQPFSLINRNPPNEPTKFAGKECEEGNVGSQSAVSVAVGATLGVVILIVIIIYAVGRRIGAINDRTGYKSVD